MKNDVGVVILRSNPVAPEPRVEKVARALSQSGKMVTIVGWDRSGSLPKIEDRVYAVINRIAIKSSYASGMRNIIPQVCWQVQLLVWLLKNRRKFSYIHACDFDTILPAFIIKALFRKKIVYDIFDFYADAHIALPAFLRTMIRRLDWWIIEKVDVTIICDEIRRTQISNPKYLAVIYNSPEDFPRNKAGKHDRQNFPGSRLKIGYVGVLSVTRGILELFSILDQHPDWSLELGGYGGADALPIITGAQTRSNVKFYGKIPYDKAMEINKRSDVLFATYDPKIPNHKFSSANKLFEAMMLGKPIIVAKGTSMDRIVQQHNLGFIVKYGDVQKLKHAFEEVANWDSEKKTQFAVHACAIYERYYSWAIMRSRLLAVYDHLSSG